MRNLRRVLEVTLFALATTLVLPAVVSAQAGTKVDVTGKWMFNVTTDAGTGTPTVTFKQQGDSLTGHYSSLALGEADFKGTAKDGKITFSFGTSVQGTNITVTYSAILESADAMKGTIDFGGYASGSFTAKKQ